MNPEDYLDEANKLFDKGNDCYKKGDYDKAIEYYTQVIAIKPDNAGAYNNRGLAYYKKKEYDKAIADYNQAIAIKPDYAEAFNNRGLAYYEKKEYDKAIADYNQAIAIKPDNANAYNNRGITYRNKKEYDKAIADYDQAIAIKPDYADAYNNRGVTYSNKGDRDKAIADYNQAIAIKPDDAKAYNNRGIAYSDKGDYDKAIADYKQAIILKRELTSLIAPRIIDIENRKIDEPVANCVKAIKKMLEYNAEELSHYTSIDVGVKLLCNNSKFRFSMAAEVNDPSEGKMLWKLLGITDEVEEKREEATSRMEVDNPVFIGCFVHKENDLNMFRFYGKDKGQEAAGCNIVYKKEAIANALKDKSSTEVNSLNNQNYTFYNVVYWDNGEVYYVGGEKEDDLIKLMDDLKKAVEDFKNSETYTKDNLNKILSSIRYLFKHSFYKEEQECRIVIYGVPLTDKEVETVYEGGVFRTFIPQKFPADAAHKLIVGPRVKDFHSLENFFKVKKGKDSSLKFTVEKSNLPFQ